MQEGKGAECSPILWLQQGGPAMAADGNPQMVKALAFVLFCNVGKKEEWTARKRTESRVVQRSPTPTDHVRSMYVGEAGRGHDLMILRTPV